MRLSSSTAVLLGLLALVAGSPEAMGGTFPVNICGANGLTAGNGLSWASAKPLSAGATCPAAGQGLSIYASGGRTASFNTTGSFKVSAPAGVTIYSVRAINPSSEGLNHSYFGSSGWWGEFYWNGGPGPEGRSGPLSDAQFDSNGCCSQMNLNS